jgi:hypothetical protein
MEIDSILKVRNCKKESLMRQVWRHHLRCQGLTTGCHTIVVVVVVVVAAVVAVVAAVALVVVASG